MASDLHVCLMRSTTTHSLIPMLKTAYHEHDDKSAPELRGLDSQYPEVAKKQFSDAPILSDTRPGSILGKSTSEDSKEGAPNVPWKNRKIIIVVAALFIIILTAVLGGALGSRKRHVRSDQRFVDLIQNSHTCMLNR